jgi:hypothetical protein
MVEGALRGGTRWPSGDPLEGVGRWEGTRAVDRDGQQLDPPVGELRQAAVSEPLLASLFRCQLLEVDLFSAATPIAFTCSACETFAGPVIV